ncbi:MAG TPA: AraC family transcriptional regulator [Pseudonocardia sp.]|uniref:AraC family transcriptional regulator n=1 Tax=Pseudonocardia sp. TaxID=60912 RepID=UPI002ED81899
MITESTDEALAAYPVARTRDIGHATEVLERILPRIPLQLRVTSAGAAFTMHMNALDVGAVTASYLRFGADIHVVNSETASYHVNVPLRGCTIWRARKYVVRSTPSVAAVLGPGTDGELMWSGGCAQLCVMLPQSSLDRELERHLDREIAEPVVFAPAMCLTSPTTRGWLDALRLVLNEADRSNGRSLHPLTTRTLENLLVGTLLLAQPHNYTAELNQPTRAASPRAVREAMELLEARPEHTWSVGELAASVHVSVRALQDAFARSAGMSPMRYLRQVRLARVRAELLDGVPGNTTVTEVAARWGFAHHGHFAAAYRAKFGEPPAGTLRR